MKTTITRVYFRHYADESQIGSIFGYSLQHVPRKDDVVKIDETGDAKWMVRQIDHEVNKSGGTCVHDILVGVTAFPSTKF